MCAAPSSSSPEGAVRLQTARPLCLLVVKGSDTLLMGRISAQELRIDASSPTQRWVLL